MLLSGSLALIDGVAGTLWEDFFQRVQLTNNASISALKTARSRHEHALVFLCHTNP